MSMPSPFEMGRSVGENVTKGINEGFETSALDQILQAAGKSDNPEEVQNVMNHILLRVSPEKREIATQLLQNRQKQIQNKKTQEEFVKIADSMEKYNPDSALHNIMANVYRSNIPIEQKTQLVKNLMNLDPYKIEQQQRLKEDSIIKNFNSLIKEIDAELKDVMISKDRKVVLEKRKERLQKERNKLTKFESLSEEAEREVLEEFNPSNPVHQKAKKAALKEAGGDTKKANEILNRKYR